MEIDWSSGLDLFLDLDRRGGLRRGIERSLREAIRDGRLTSGTALPSARSLAHDLGTARGTITAAYGQLAAEGYLTLRQGAPTQVTWVPRRRPPPASALARPARCQWDLRPGRPAGGSFPRHAWARAHRLALARAPDEMFDYGDARGSAELRESLAGYLGRARGVDTDPGRLLVCNGFTQALALSCHVLRAAGATTLAVEDPGAPRYRRLAETLGLSVVPVSCDQDGLRTDQIARAGADAVLVTPAHQYPLGVTMSAARRTGGMGTPPRCADHRGRLRRRVPLRRQPVGALQQLDPDHVIYAGSASKTLAPGLRLGWLSAPPAMASAIAAARQHLDRGTGILDQLTLAELIASGAFDTHIRRMRASYRRRRDELERALASSLPRLQLAGISAGLHALIYLPEGGPTEHQVAARAARYGVGLHTLTSYWHDPPELAPQAVVIGYGTPASHAYRPALRALTRLLAPER